MNYLTYFNFIKIKNVFYLNNMNYNSPKKELINLSEQLNSFSKIFFFEEYNDYFLDYLSSIKKPSNNVCAKIFKKDEKAIRCQECSKYDTSIICLDCYERTKDIHKSHTIFYETEDLEGGCCDCGNPDVWDKNTFCPIHKGSFLNEKEIDIFIKDNFSEDIIDKITNWFNNIIKLLVPYFLDLEQIEENKKKEEIEGILEDFLAFLSNIFKANSALIHLVSKCLVKNYPYQTNHICIVINENNEMKINDYNGEIHMCDCSFLKIILSVWSKRINNEELLFFFLQNFRMKVIIGLTYIAIYDKIINNKPPNLYEFIYQIYNSDIILNLIKSPILISNMFKYYYKYLENDIKNNAFIKIENRRSSKNYF